MGVVTAVVTIITVVATPAGLVVAACVVITLVSGARIEDEGNVLLELVLVELLAESLTELLVELLTDVVEVADDDSDDPVAFVEIVAVAVPTNTRLLAILEKHVAVSQQLLLSVRWGGAHVSAHA